MSHLNTPGSQRISNEQAVARVKLPRRFAFFGVSNPDDQSTALSSKYLIQPLLETFSKKEAWEVQPFLKEAATRNQLERLLGGDQTPALLFTASHGMEFDQTDKRQIPHQGALLCQDWPGIGTIREDHYFAASDIPDGAQVAGMINFHFACYSVGTPQHVNFIHKVGQKPLEIAQSSFVAMLPKKLLARP